ncbi:hypothetical protein BASA81_007578 [Batrachochytrium salamandrivorans]|nr:hypothetical protein BASA81_007578 [Batrachochytrium salamandrivorans]
MDNAESLLEDEEGEMERFFAKYMFPETLEAFLQEKNRAFRRTHHSSNDNPSWVCIVCKKTFSKKGTAKRHCETAHATFLVPAAAPGAAAAAATGGGGAASTAAAECLHCNASHPSVERQFPRPLISHVASTNAEGLLVVRPLGSGAAGGGGEGDSKRLKAVTHEEHIDLVLPSGAIVCPPPPSQSPVNGTTTSSASQPDCCAPKLVQTSCCAQDKHIRVQHDDHEDVLVRGTLRHFNRTDKVWENHGELWSLEHDLDYLMEAEANALAALPALKSGSLGLPQGSSFYPPAFTPVHSQQQQQQYSDSMAISSVLEAMNACNNALMPPPAHSHSHGEHSHSHGEHSHSHGEHSHREHAL